MCIEVYITYIYAYIYANWIYKVYNKHFNQLEMRVKQQQQVYMDILANKLNNKNRQRITKKDTG